MSNYGNKQPAELAIISQIVIHMKISENNNLPSQSTKLKQYCYSIALDLLLQFKHRKLYNKKHDFNLSFQMQRNQKVKNKLSYSPNSQKKNTSTMRARFAKQSTNLNSKLLLDLNLKIKRHFLQSAYKSKRQGSLLFREAHRIDSRNTYLVNDKLRQECKTKGSSTPMSPLIQKQKVMTRSFFTKAYRGLSHSRADGDRRDKKDVEQTVSITVKNKCEDLPNQQKQMTTLSRLILGDYECQDGLCLQFIGESSINREQQNFNEVDSFLLKQVFSSFRQETKELNGI